MSFDLNILVNGANKRIQMTDTLNGTMIELHSKGGLMNRWVVENAGQPLELILGNPTPNLSSPEMHHALSFEMNGFRSGKMSPFSCRINEGKYQLNDQTYQFEKFYLGAHAMHGLIYDAEFAIHSTELHTNYATTLFSFTYQGTDPGYPFPFDIQIQWTLHQDNIIGLKTTIINQSNQLIPLMDGWHPYFSLGGIVDDYELAFQSKARIAMRDDMIPNGKTIEDNQFAHGLQIGATHFDDCYLLAPTQNQIQISYEGKSILVCPQHNYPFLQLYTPNDRQSIAIENLSGAPDCFNNKMGLQQLEPQEAIYFETRYQFKTT